MGMAIRNPWIAGTQTTHKFILIIRITRETQSSLR